MLAFVSFVILCIQFRFETYRISILAVFHIDIGEYFFGRFFYIGADFDLNVNLYLVAVPGFYIHRSELVFDIQFIIRRYGIGLTDRSFVGKLKLLFRLR